MKSILFLLFFLSSTGSFAQDRSYQNKNAAATETITFSLQGDIIVDGEWEHVSNNPNTSGEVYGFTGKKVNNKLVITFTGTVPYTIPGSKRKAEWVLSGKVLKIAMKIKGRIKIVIFSIVQ